MLFAIVALYLSHDFQMLRASVENVALFAVGVSLTAITLVLDSALIGLLRGEVQLAQCTFCWGKTCCALSSGTLAVTRNRAVHIRNLGHREWTLTRSSGQIRPGERREETLCHNGDCFGSPCPALKHHALNLTLDAPVMILPILVTVLLSATTNAWFYVSWSISSIANILTAILTTTLFAVGSAQPTEFARKLRLTLSLSLGTTACITCVLLLGTTQVFWGLFGPELCRPGCVEPTHPGIRIFSLYYQESLHSGISYSTSSNTCYATYNSEWYP